MRLSDLSSFSPYLLKSLQQKICGIRPSHFGLVDRTWACGHMPQILARSPIEVMQEAADQ